MEGSDNVITLTNEELMTLSCDFDNYLRNYGLECYPFKVGWYNDLVSKHFTLPYSEETIAFTVISQPSMFEKTFVPYLLDIHKDKLEDDTSIIQDPLDTCMNRVFTKFRSNFSSYDMITIQDFELTPSRRPKIVIQTAGHVCGGVTLYQRKDMNKDPWDEDKNMFGVCLHPRFGGWFALRGVAILPFHMAPTFNKTKTKNILNNDEQIQDLLERYNGNWKDWSYRDVISVEEKYSNLQREYFYNPPGNRLEIIKKIINEYKET